VRARVCAIVGHTDRPDQQSNQFVTDVKVLVKKKMTIMIMIMIMILRSRSDDDKDIKYGSKK